MLLLLFSSSISLMFDIFIIFSHLVFINSFIMLVNILYSKIIPTKLVPCRTWENPVKMLLKDLTRKGPFFLHTCKILLQDPARSCGILQESWTKFLQDLAGKQEKRIFSCKSIFTGEFRGKIWQMG